MTANMDRLNANEQAQSGKKPKNSVVIPMICWTLSVLP